MIVFLTSGLWHGADWSFVLWGGIHGFYQVIDDVTEKLRNKPDSHERKNRLLQLEIPSDGSDICSGGVCVIFSEPIRSGTRLWCDQTDLICQTPWVLFDGEIYNLGLTDRRWNILLVSLVILFLVDLVTISEKQTLDVLLMSSESVV